MYQISTLPLGHTPSPRGFKKCFLVQIILGFSCSQSFASLWVLLPLVSTLFPSFQPLTLDKRQKGQQLPSLESLPAAQGYVWSLPSGQLISCCFEYDYLNCDQQQPTKNQSTTLTPFMALAFIYPLIPNVTQLQKLSIPVRARVKSQLPVVHSI